MPQIAIYIEGARQVLEISDTRLAAALERTLDRLALWDGDTDPPGYRLPTGERQASVGTVAVPREVAAIDEAHALATAAVIKPMRWHRMGAGYASGEWKLVFIPERHGTSAKWRLTHDAAEGEAWFRSKTEAGQVVGAVPDGSAAAFFRARAREAAL